MGLGFALLIWDVVGVSAAAVGGLVLGRTAAYFTRGVQRGRKKLFLAASLFPLACLGWMGVVFIFQAIVNETALHRDAGLGDSWNCPLPNGYALLMIDTTDQGSVYNPKTQPYGSVGEREDAIAGVRLLQVAGRYILGGSDSRSFERLEDQGERVDSYFLLDTQLGKQSRFPNYDALRSKATELGISPHLESIASIYHRYRFTWFDAFVVLLGLVARVVSALLLLRWILRLRELNRVSLTPA
jgi:hypothetical protein